MKSSLLAGSLYWALVCAMLSPTRAACPEPDMTTVWQSLFSGAKLSRDGFMIYEVREGNYELVEGIRHNWWEPRDGKITYVELMFILALKDLGYLDVTLNGADSSSIWTRIMGLAFQGVLGTYSVQLTDKGRAWTRDQSVGLTSDGTPADYAENLLDTLIVPMSTPGTIEVQKIVSAKQGSDEFKIAHLVVSVEVAPLLTALNTKMLDLLSSDLGKKIRGQQVAECFYDPRSPTSRAYKVILALKLDADACRWDYHLFDFSNSVEGPMCDGSIEQQLSISSPAAQ